MKEIDPAVTKRLSTGALEELEKELGKIIQETSGGNAKNNSMEANRSFAGTSDGSSNPNEGVSSNPSNPSTMLLSATALDTLTSSLSSANEFAAELLYLLKTAGEVL